jgi:hypothetical protein
LTVVAHPLDGVLERIRERFNRLSVEGTLAAEFLAHLESLATFHEENFESHPKPDPVEFPPSLPVAFAVCNADCGAREFVVDGSTQECQRCGALMFRVAVASYALE